MDVTDPWKANIERLFKEKRLSSYQCMVYDRASRTETADEKCPCRRPIRHHSFDGPCLTEKPTRDKWNVRDHTKPLDSIIFRSTASAKFLRCACANQADIATLYELINAVCDENQKPKLIVSVYGGHKYFTMQEDIEREFMESLAEAAGTTGTWVTTSGLNNGAAKLIGEGVARLHALRNRKQPMVLLGIVWWGYITQRAREMVLELQDENLLSPTQADDFRAIMPLRFDDKDTKSLEQNHTHFLLLDDGEYSREGNQKPPANYSHQIIRSDFVTYACKKANCFGVTIVVAGGNNPCPAILNDINNKRPVIFIQGSGKLADMIGKLVELTAPVNNAPARAPTSEEVQYNLSQSGIRTKTKAENDQRIKEIIEILHPQSRMYLTVFRSQSELNLKQTILQAIFKAHYAQMYEDSISSDRKERTAELKSQKEHLLNLAIEWDCFDQATQLLEELQYNSKPELIARLFEQALKKNRPFFVDFFLRINFDPRCIFGLIYKSEQSSGPQRMNHRRTSLSTIVKLSDIAFLHYNQVHLNKCGLAFLFKLYEDQASNINRKTTSNDIETEIIAPRSIAELNAEYFRWIGRFMFSLFYQQTPFQRFMWDLSRLWHATKQHTCCCLPACCGSNAAEAPSDENNDSSLMVVSNPLFTLARDIEMRIRDGSLAQEGTQFLLRDLLFWAVFTNRIELIKALLLHIQPRICAALCCVAIFKKRARKSTASDQSHIHMQLAVDLETYAADCIDTCFAVDERKACELLLREVPLFGKITCMQIAIAAESQFFINSACFDRALSRVWLNKLSPPVQSFVDIVKMFFSLLSFGVLAPWLVTYRLAENDDEFYNQEESETTPRKIHNKVAPLSRENEKRKSMGILKSQLSYNGINYYTRYSPESLRCGSCYVKKFKHFHQCPMVKMCYDFAGYIWLLLVFTYMVLFRFNSPKEVGYSFHWTEGYVIATVSIMLVEDLRRKVFYYVTSMRERESKTWTSLGLSVSMQTIGYVLFYVGIILRYAYADRDECFTAARIILAIDLELWFIFSLKFISAVPILGPKIFMVRNMLRDLSSFLYVAFIFIAAYGVTSRAMIKYGEVEFTAKSIFTNIFYPTYWFLYSDIQNERSTLDNIITGNSSTSSLIAAATVTHVLFAFHMLFLNILLLNLLIAIFTTSINKVENNTKFYWHYQRYTFIQEYFEKPVLPVSPLIFFSYIGLIVRHVWFYIHVSRNNAKKLSPGKYDLSGIFKMIPADSKFTERCTAFEHAATYNHARYAAEGFFWHLATGCRETGPYRLTKAQSTCTKCSFE